MLLQSIHFSLKSARTGEHWGMGTWTRALLHYTWR
jgi:hypothetical protein